jgi:hypothetical protein
MTTKSFKKPRKIQTSSRSRTALPRQLATSPKPSKSMGKSADARQSRGPRRTAHHKRNGETSEWIRVGLLLVGFVTAVLIAVHFLGGTGTPSAPTASGNQPSENTSTPGSNVSGTTGGINSVSSTPGVSNFPANWPPMIDTAQALKISPAALLSDLQSGQTVAQIAQAQHVDIATVNTAYLRGVKESLSQFTSDQSRIDQAYQKEQQGVQNGKYDLLG